MNDDMPELGLEFFDTYFAFAPAALALRECVRLAAIREIDLPAPILDVGCGDGIFARLAYPDRQVWGIDINATEIRRAQATATYATLICGSITSTDLPKEYFRSVIANCSLEHVPDIRGAFRTIGQSLVPGGRFVLIVPSPRWTEQLPMPRTLESVGLPSLASAYRSGLDRLFRHVHMYDGNGWTQLLRDAGFVVDRMDPIVSPAVTAAFDLLLYPSVAGYALKSATGHWTLLPELRRRLGAIPRGVIRGVARVFSRDATEDPGEYVIVAHRERT